MKLVVNGKELEVKNSINIEELLDNLKIKDKVMAVAVNMEIVKKENWNSATLKENDKVELLHFVGGG
jgi:sulfur carrier protein